LVYYSLRFLFPRARINSVHLFCMGSNHLIPSIEDCADTGSVSLVVVLPFYNESDSLEHVVRQWSEMLTLHCPNHIILLVSDCPTDGSLVIARTLSKAVPRVVVLENHENLGHGGSCLRGYLWALSNRASWVAQVDTDGQCDPKYFPAIWDNRGCAPFHLGYRAKRLDGFHRFLASRFLELLVFARSGAYAKDPNSPYRLMSAKILESGLAKVPASFDLVNVALSCIFVREGTPTRYYPIVFLDRHGGKPSAPLILLGKKLWRLWVALPSLWQSGSLSEKSPLI